MHNYIIYVINKRCVINIKRAWYDLKSFVTIAMIIILFVIVIGNLSGLVLEDNILILVTNLMTAVFTYYFTKMDIEEK